MSKTKWYARPIYLLVALALVLSLGIVALPMARTVAAQATLQVNATTGTVHTGDPCPDPRDSATYADIQAAINCALAGDTINVAAGTYTLTAPTWEGLIIDKSVTLQGTGTPTIDSTGAMVAVHITVDDVTLNGFRVSNASTMGVYLDGVSGCTVTSNRFEGLASGPIVKVKEEGSSNTISNNVFIGDDIETGIELEESGSNEVFGNDFSGTDWGTSATAISIGPSGSHPSDSNLVYDNTITSSGFQTGINLGWSDHNKIHDNEISGGEVGIKVSLDTYTEIYGNTIDSNTEKGIWLYHSENDSIYDNTISSNGKGIVLQPEEQVHGSWPDYTYTYVPCKNNVIENNNITGNTDVGVYIEPKHNETKGNNIVRYNNITGNTNYGIKNDNETGTLDAEFNYWGDASGPLEIDEVGSEENPHGASASGDNVSDNVDFMPWYATSTTTSSTQYVSVEHNPIIAYSDTIQGGIDAAVTGDTVNVAAGTYAEALTVDKSITLQGTGTPTIDCSDRATLGLAKTDGCIEVTADNVTIQAFKFIGYDCTVEDWNDQWSSSNFPTILATDSADSLKVKDSEFVAPTGGKVNVGLRVKADCDDVEFTGNTVTDFLQCVAAQNKVDNLSVRNNTFDIPIAENTTLPHDKAYGYGVQLWHGNNLTVINNTFTGSWDTATGDYEDPDALCNHYAVATFTTYYEQTGPPGFPDIDGDIHVQDNEMSNLYLGVGVMSGADAGDIKDNNIHDNLIGIQLGQVSGTWATAPAQGAQITGNDINDNKRGIWAQNIMDNGIAAHFNNIVGNTEYGVINEDPDNDVFDATCNWWGDASGPSGAGPGTGDAVSSNVIFVPWLLSEDGPCLGGLTPAQLKEEAKTELNSIYPTGDKKVDKGLEKAIKHLDKSMDEDLWPDDTHLEAKHGKKVFDEEKKTVNELMHLIDKKDTPDEVKDVCQAVMSKLVMADSLLARTAYEEAQAYAGDPKVDKELEKCEKEFTKADEELAKGKYDKAIKHYKNAWKHAQKALGKAPEDDEEP